MEYNNIFQEFSAFREKLQGICSRANTLLSTLEQKKELQTLKAYNENLSTDTFKVLVIGEFKRGKSTFINALLGQEVLPAFSIPCTAVINEIKYSEEKKAVLHFVDPLPEDLSGLAKDVKDHINTYKGKGVIPPMEVPVNRIEEFVVIPDPGKDQAQSVSESPFSLVEIFWPIELCKNRIEIIDSPGLNEHGTRTKVTTDYLSQADAIIFVLSCSALASQSELQVIEDSIIAGGHEEIFFVCNRFDEVRERDRQRLMDYAKKRLGDKTTLGDSGIHFLSSLDALDAKIEHNEEVLEKSRFPELEKDLMSFLVKDRGQLKLLRPANMLKRQIRKVLRDTFPMQKGLLYVDLDKLNNQYEEVKPKLEEAERKRALLVTKMMNKSNQIKEYVRREIKNYISSLAKEIPCMIEKYNTSTKISFLKVANTKKQCQEMTKELLSFLEADLSKRQMEWTQDFLLPEVERQMNEICEYSQKDIESFSDIIDGIRKDFYADGLNDDQRDVPAWERITAAGAGFVLFGFGGTVQAGQDGFKGLAKAALPQVGAIICAGLLGIMNPWILIPMLFTTGGISAWLSNKKLEEKLRKSIGEKVKDNMLELSEASAKDAAVKIGDFLDPFIAEADTEMKNEITSIRENVEKILQKKKENEVKVKDYEVLLTSQQKEAEILFDALDEFVDEVRQSSSHCRRSVL